VRVELQGLVFGDGGAFGRHGRFLGRWCEARKAWRPVVIFAPGT
jgi:hypothetical protein